MDLPKVMQLTKKLQSQKSPLLPVQGSFSFLETAG
jgi:hypothetical protein